MEVECRSDVAICGGLGEFIRSVTRAEESGAMWRVVARVLTYPIIYLWLGGTV